MILNKLKIKRPRVEIEPQETFLDGLAQTKQEEIGVSEKKLEVPLSRLILKALFFVFFILMLALFSKTFQLGVLEEEALSQRASENKFAIDLVQAERGVIYDRNLNLLVTNRPSFDFICQGETIIENLDHQTLVELTAKRDEYPQCEIKNNIEREYLEGTVFSHLLGYQRKTGENTGLEKYYDQILSPEPGQIRIEKDAGGNFISKQIISSPKPGKNLVLWLDSKLQQKLTQALKKSISRAGKKAAGAAVALDPRTGGVLALVSLPSFDNNLFSQGITKPEWQRLQKDPSHPFHNRVISGFGYPTGSVIKPLMGLAALEEGIIGPETQIYCPLEICIQNPWNPKKEDCYRDWKYHGTSDLRKAIAESVNTFFYQVGGGYEDFKGLGEKKIKKWLQIFGWGEKTGIDLPGEDQGILPNVEKEWHLGDTYHLSIGQGPFSIPPIQVARAYGAIANGGILYQPRVVQKIIDINHRTIREIEPKILRKISAKSENLQVIRQGMRQAVTTPDMPSYILNSLPVDTACKTGTAQTSKKNVYHNWVTVFAPYQNPEIVLTVVIENVEGMRAVVLPVAKEVLSRYFSTSDR